MLRGALLLLLLFLAGTAHAGDGTDCYNPSEGRGNFGLRAHFKDAYDKGSEEPDPAKRLRRLEDLRSWARPGLERALVDVSRARHLQLLHRAEEARGLLLPLLEDPVLPRIVADEVRGHLAFAAAQDKNWERTIALLEPIYKENCPTMPQRGSHLLAMAYLESRRPADALAVLDWTQEQPPREDHDWWTAVQVELRCKLVGAEACVDAIASVVERGGTSADLADVLNTLLGRAAAAPGAAEALAKARAAGLVDADIHVVVRPALQIEELKPTKRVAPSYPIKAQQAMKEGLVEMRVTVAPDGTVKDATVVYAYPRGYFEAASIAAAKEGRFEPRMENGVPVETIGTYTIRYNFAR